MAFTGSVEDRLAIRELYGTYGDSSWRGDGELWASLFTPDGRWATHFFDVSGREALLATWNGLWKDWDAVAFLGEIGAIEVTGDTAQVRSYAREVVKMKNGVIFKLCGHYADTLVKVDGEWKYQSRIYTPSIEEFPADMPTPAELQG